MNYNTIYQLWCDKKSGKMDKAERMLLIPEYLSYRLTGVMKNEYTNASTTNLLNAENKDWDFEVIEKLGFKKSLFGELNLPGTYIGNLTDEIKEKVGFDAKVIFCPSHDTASAVAACPIDEKSIFISSGTWSLIGTENTVPVLSKKALDTNFTNEGGIEYRFRFLKNIMGMWLFQNIRKNLDKKYTYDEMMFMAMESNFTEKIDPTDDVLNSVYHSLAFSYDKTVKEIERISGKTVDTVSIVGGGCKDKYLNTLTKQYTGKRVTAGPVEGTAAGNLISQLMYLNPDMKLLDARKIIIDTFEISEV